VDKDVALEIGTNLTLGEVEMARVGAYAVVHIHDSGPVIPEELQGTQLRSVIHHPNSQGRHPGWGSVSCSTACANMATLWSSPSKPGDGYCFAPIAAPSD